MAEPVTKKARISITLGESSDATHIRGRPIEKTAPTDGDILRYNAEGNQWNVTVLPPIILNHEDLLGLDQDDHPQYIKADGTRALENDWNAGKSIAADRLFAANDVTTSVINEFVLDGGVAVDGCFLKDGKYNNVDIEQVEEDLQTLESNVGGFPQQLKQLTTGEIQQLENIDNTTIGSSAWTHVGSMDQSVNTTSSPTFSKTTVGTYDSPSGSNWTSSEALNGGTSRLYLGHDFADRMHKYPVLIGQPCLVVGTGTRSENYRLNHNRDRYFELLSPTMGTTNTHNSWVIFSVKTIPSEKILRIGKRNISTVESFSDIITPEDLTTFELYTNGGERLVVDSSGNWKINGNDISNSQWGILSTLDQSLSTTSDPEFNSVKVDVLHIEDSSISNTELQHLVNLDQSLSTTSSPTFTSVKTPTVDPLNSESGVSVGGVFHKDGGIAASALNTITIETDSVNGHSISNTQWGYVSDLDQSLKKTSEVEFHLVTADNATIKGKEYPLKYVTYVSTDAFYSLNNDTLSILTISDGQQDYFNFITNPISPGKIDLPGGIWLITANLQFSGGASSGTGYRELSVYDDDTLIVASSLPGISGIDTSVCLSTVYNVGETPAQIKVYARQTSGQHILAGVEFPYRLSCVQIG